MRIYNPHKLTTFLLRIWSHVRTFIPGKTWRTEKSGEGFEFSPRENTVFGTVLFNFLFILKQTKNLSTSQNLFLNEIQSFLKDIQLLPFQEWYNEMSHTNILTKLQFQKNYQCSLYCVAVWFRITLSAQHFLLCQLWFVIFQSTRFKKGNALFSNPIQTKNSGDVLEAVQNTSLPCKSQYPHTNSPNWSLYISKEVVERIW